ncbi:plasmalemma vesicle associated protein a [Fundulus heteroclitus]|uniref:plasmalemma vesicle associated protein a n=1 Tax=Fundulus heteroclitus TaxID=8078 RepID=UPI00165A348C|nr:plasmalemma vesicle associated protein a [Fundulus heteroclitus]
MYSSSYSKVTPAAQKKMQYRPKGKSCGYYMRIIFFFSSLIQSLIIVSLVLFLIYGKTQDSASSAQDLEESHSRLSIENVALRAQRKNLTNLLNVTITEKAKNDWDLRKIRNIVNRSITMFQDMDKQLLDCNQGWSACKYTSFVNQGRSISPQPPGNCNCGLLVQQMKAGLEMLESNLTQTKRIMAYEKELISKERDALILEAIRLRRDKSTVEKELELFKEQSKDNFAKLLGPVSTVSQALLGKIESLFPKHIAFQLTCPKQMEHLEQIQSNCTSLSREVENKLQRYLDIVGDQVSKLQFENNHLKAENWRFSEDYRWCSQNRTGMIEQHKRNREELQLNHDREKERLLMDKMRMAGEIEVLKTSVKYKDAEVDVLKGQINQLNMSCMGRAGPGGFPGGVPGSRSTIPNPHGMGSFGGGGSNYSPFGSPSLGQGRTGIGSGTSFGSGLGGNRVGSTGAGSSSSTQQQPGLSQTLTNMGQGFNKPGSVGAGSSSSSFLTPGLRSSIGNTGVGSEANKPASSGRAFANSGSVGSSLGSSGTGSNKPAEGGRSSTTFGSSLGSLGSSLNQGSSGTGSNKPAEGGKSSTTFGSLFGSLGSSLNQGSSGTGLTKPASGGKSSPSFGFGSSSVSSGTSATSGSSGSTSKTSSSFPWFGQGSSTSGQSKTGSVPGRTSAGSGIGGTGSMFGGAKTNGVSGGSAITQHIQELQRLINPQGPQEKQDLSRALG